MAFVSGFGDCACWTSLFGDSHIGEPGVGVADRIATGIPELVGRWLRIRGEDFDPVRVVSGRHDDDGPRQNTVR